MNGTRIGCVVQGCRFEVLGPHFAGMARLCGEHQLRVGSPALGTRDRQTIERSAIDKAAARAALPKRAERRGNPRPLPKRTRGAIVLVLCKPCTASVADPSDAKWIGNFQQLPALCPECGAKIAQCVRLLVTGCCLLTIDPTYAIGAP